MGDASHGEQTHGTRGTTLNRDQVEGEVVAAANDLVARHPAIDTIVFECTNLPPYKTAVQDATGLAVFDVIDLLNDFYAGLGAPQNVNARPG